MALMRLKSFFEMFDSAGDKLKLLGDSHLHNPWSGRRYDKEYSIDRARAKCLVTGTDETDGFWGDFGGVSGKPFQNRKGDIRVCRRLGVCFVPRNLMKDIRWAERKYNVYSKDGGLSVGIGEGASR